MKKQNYIKQLYSLVRNPNLESLSLSMDDVHHKGLFSLVIAGTEFGKLTRVFIAGKKMKPYSVQLHSHRYPIKLTVIKGDVRHFVAIRKGSMDAHTVQLSEFDYKNPFNGGQGLTYVKESNVSIKEYILPVSSTVKMSSDEVHTVSCSKGAIWAIEEGGFETESSKLFGVPFQTEGLYNKAPWKVSLHLDLVAVALSNMFIDFKSSN
tara:strand:+ start:1398 stop:2018 length:621 start_codon:yes stop_codon:yes gene_type:complete